MRDIYLYRNKLKRDSLFLSNYSKEDKLSMEEVLKVRKRQNDFYKKYKFFDNYLKYVNKGGKR